MNRKARWISVIVPTLAMLSAWAVAPARADGQTPPPYNPDYWLTGVGPVANTSNNFSGGGAEIGTLPGFTDDYNGANATPLYMGDGPQVDAAFYRQNGAAAGDEPVWAGPTGFYADIRGPITPGGSKTYWGLYLWAYAYAPNPVNPIKFEFYSSWTSTPMGCEAHLVLDQIPASANWTGPDDFWIDLSQTAGTSVFLTLPIVEVTDPLQGTEMHITVYAPIPEPSPLVALTFGLLPLGVLWRKGRH